MLRTSLAMNTIELLVAHPLLRLVCFCCSLFVTIKKQLLSVQPVTAVSSTLLTNDLQEDSTHRGMLAFSRALVCCCRGLHHHWVNTSTATYVGGGLPSLASHH